MGTDKHPAIPCEKNYKTEEAAQFKNFIHEDYRYNLYLDGLPAAVRVRDPQTGELETHYQDGIPIGYFDEMMSKYVVYNHLHMEVLYNQPSGKGKQVVGLEVEPRSYEQGTLISWDYSISAPV